MFVSDNAVKKDVTHSDVQLWGDFQIGSESAYASIYEKHVSLLFSYGLKLVSDKELVKDSIQDLFIELWNTKHRLAKVQSIKAYLCKSLRRKLFAHTAKQRKLFNENTNVETLNEKVFSIEISLIEKQRFDAQRKALKKGFEHLTATQKEILHLKFHGKLNYTEIAETMSMDKKGVYNLMARTIKVLRDYLKDSFKF